MAMAKWRNKCINITTRLSLNWWPRQACKHDGTTDPCGTWAVSMLTYIHFKDFFFEAINREWPKAQCICFLRIPSLCSTWAAVYLIHGTLNDFLDCGRLRCGVRCALPSFTPYVLQPSPLRLLFHAAPMAPDAHRSFNFNKLRSFLISRVRAPSDEYDIDIDIDEIRCAFFPTSPWVPRYFDTVAEARVGVELDSDQFVGPGVDYMPLELQVFRSSFPEWLMMASNWSQASTCAGSRWLKRRRWEELFFGFCFYFLLLQFVALKWPWINNYGWLHLLVDACD